MVTRARREPFDKYWYYLRAVQDPPRQMAELADIDRQARERARTRDPQAPGPSAARIMSEDFAGTFANACAWVARAPDHEAHAIDLDPEALAWGRAHVLPTLPEAARARVHIHEQDVLAKGLPAADLICALNFSYYLLRTRAALGAYFRACLERLLPGGLLVLDMLGGAEHFDVGEVETELDEHGFSFVWDQTAFDPITHHATFHLHFKRPGEKRRERVFTYTWRLWTLPELVDLLRDSGFGTVEVLWEGDGDDGDGDGIFSVAESAAPCASWNAYLVASR